MPTTSATPPAVRTAVGHGAGWMNDSANAPQYVSIHVVIRAG